MAEDWIRKGFIATPSNELIFFDSESFITQTQGISFYIQDVRRNQIDHYMNDSIMVYELDYDVVTLYTTSNDIVKLKYVSYLDAETAMNNLNIILDE